MKILYLIPARAGSKRLPNKNTKILGDKPLVVYTIQFALMHMKPGDELCISTDDEKVINIAKDMNIEVPFIRPDELASDNATSYDVIIHAINFYERRKKEFDFVLLLQPTSPFRTDEDFEDLFNECDDSIDMVVSVKTAKENPYFTLFEENSEGMLFKSKSANFERRQDYPAVYAFNGSMYLIRTASILRYKISEFKNIRKVVMPENRSVDIDTMADWLIIEYYLNSFDSNS